MSPSYDFVIVGGGPAGLSAAIAAARNGCSALLLEQGARLGPYPRGEGVNHFPLFDELLGKGFLQKHSFKTTHGAVYHSPRELKQAAAPARSPLYFFEWREFIDRLGEVAAADGATLQTGCQVTGIVEDQAGHCAGVRYVDADGAEHSAAATTVLGCDGYSSVVGRHYGVDYDALSCPIMKCRLTSAHFDPADSMALQFFLIGNGDLPEAPRFPPCVAYAFPLPDQKMEAGLMLRMGRARTMASVDRPSQAEFVAVWSQLKASYPKFSGYFAGANLEHEQPTDLPNASLLHNNVPAPGAVLLGDSAGFIDPFGSSGIYSSMSMARQWTDRIAASTRKAGGEAQRVWTRRNLARWRRDYYASGIFRHVQSSYLRVGVLEWLMFRQLRSAERINQSWPLIKRLLKLG